jgi:hypothetical protein
MAMPTKTNPNAPVRPQPILSESTFEFTKLTVRVSKKGCANRKPMTQRRGNMQAANWNLVAFKVDQNSAFVRDLLAFFHEISASLFNVLEVMPSSTGNRSFCWMVRLNPFLINVFNHQKKLRL